MVCSERGLELLVCVLESYLKVMIRVAGNFFGNRSLSQSMLFRATNVSRRCPFRTCIAIILELISQIQPIKKVPFC
jgi:hypothetical protein